MLGGWSHAEQQIPPEIRERAVRLVVDHEHEYPSQWKAICSIADKSNLNRETLRPMGPSAGA
jgi:transposase